MYSKKYTMSQNQDERNCCEVENCCICVELRTGVTIIGILSSICSSIALIVNLIFIVGKYSYPNKITIAAFIPLNSMVDIEVITSHKFNCSNNMVERSIDKVQQIDFKFNNKLFLASTNENCK